MSRFKQRNFPDPRYIKLLYFKRANGKVIVQSYICTWLGSYKSEIKNNVGHTRLIFLVTGVAQWVIWVNMCDPPSNQSM